MDTQPCTRLHPAAYWCQTSSCFLWRHTALGWGCSTPATHGISVKHRWTVRHTATQTSNAPFCSSWPAWRTALCPSHKNSSADPSWKEPWRSRAPWRWRPRWGRSGVWSSCTQTTARPDRWAGWAVWCAGLQRMCTKPQKAYALSHRWASHPLPTKHREQTLPSVLQEEIRASKTITFLQIITQVQTGSFLRSPYIRVKLI